MKASDIQKEHMTNHIIEQLHKLSHYDTDGKSYEELKQKLALIRATEVNAGDPGKGWF